jgi:L-threonylcarbamoyladenylate synthase
LIQIGTNIPHAAALLQAGQLIGLPTETVYGLAGNAFNAQAISQIFETKNRPSFDPLIVHIHKNYELQKIVKQLPNQAQLLMQAFMPGPLTLLLPKQDSIPDLVTAGLPRVAIRMPKHPIAQQLLALLPFPLAAPSANPFGYISPTTAQHVAQQLGSKIPYILDGGPCSIGLESTIVAFDGPKTIILRKGGLAVEAIEALIGPTIIQEHSSSNPAAPGMLKSHYAPHTPIQLLLAHQSPSNPHAGYLGFDQPEASIVLKNQLLLSPTGSLSEAAQHLFAYLRQLDSLNLPLIYTRLLPEQGLGRAINDRLRRATAK